MTGLVSAFLTCSFNARGLQITPCDGPEKVKGLGFGVHEDQGLGFGV